MEKLVKDLESLFKVEKIVEKTGTHYRLSGVPYCPPKQSVIDSFREKKVYDKYLMCLEKEIFIGM